MNMQNSDHPPFNTCKTSPASNYYMSPDRCKAILALGAAQQLLEMAGIASETTSQHGIFRVVANKVGEALPDFIAAIAEHRQPTRDSDPPEI